MPFLKEHSVSNHLSIWPRRIICLTTETTEMVFALGAGDRVAGVSGYSVRPLEARKKEKVAAFTSVRMDKIREIRPDLILGFSDLQKDILRDLVGEGFNVFVTNQRSLDEVGEALIAIGRLLGLEEKAREICDQFYREIDRLTQSNPSPCPLPASGARETKSFPLPFGERVGVRGKPLVYFEEWDDPLISGIRWVSELIERLGGEDIFSDKSEGKIAQHRVISSEDIISANPDIIIASWCGKKVQKEKIRSRPGWDRIKAVREGRIYEIKSPDILAPGLSLIHGARQIAQIFSDFRA